MTRNAAFLVTLEADIDGRPLYRVEAVTSDPMKLLKPIMKGIGQFAKRKTGKGKNAAPRHVVRVSCSMEAVTC